MIARRVSRAASVLFAAMLSAAMLFAAVFFAAMFLAAVSLIACSSSVDVVASIDEPSSAAPTPSAGGAPAPTVVQAFSATAAPGAPAPAGTPLLPPPIAGSASAGIERPPPPDARVAGEALFVSGTPQSPPLAGAERWPLAEPLRQFFRPAPEQQPVVMVVLGRASEPLRELALRHGLGVVAVVEVLVEDEWGDQFALLLSDDPPLADEPLPADD